MRKTFFYLPVISVVLLIISSCHYEKSSFTSQELNDNWQFRQAGADSLIDAEVPGCVHLDLIYNNIIEDPFYRDNERNLQWIETREWEYECTFDVKQELLNADKLELAFEGIDTYANVFLNDKLLFEADNMFRTWIIDCKGLLHAEDNKLLVHFFPAVEVGQQKSEKLPYALPDIRGFSRKAPYHYGWDWGPRFVGCGIWRSVSIIAWNQFIIDNIHIQQKDLSEEMAQMAAQITIESIEDQLVEISIQDKFSGDELVSNEFTLAKGNNIVNFTFNIEHPKLWWPNGWGEAHLYNLAFTVRAGDFKDTEDINIGLRTIRLVQEEDEEGTSFYFEVNGKALFARGANYIPQESFTPRLREKNYLQVIEAAKDANMNMLRVWGGGIYEEDIFYDLCDENGILVWQDFMFACNMYPGDEGFLESVRQEAIDNVVRLRNHPSIALWCGNNEIDEGWKNWGWQQQLGYTYNDSVKVWSDYVRLFHEVLPGVIEDFDPSRSYWPSSPSMGWGHGAAYHSGDVHYWGVWWGEEPFEMYEKKVGRFMSEYGFQGMPDLRTIEQFTLDADREIGSAVMEAHQKHPRGTLLIDKYMARDYQVPVAFEDYVYVSQLVQAEGIRTALEAHRRAKPYCMGTLYWQLNDCWPVSSWSGIDYYGRWKALHYFVRKAYEPIILTCDMDSIMDFYIINDAIETYKASFEISIQDFGGIEQWTHRMDVNIQPNANKKVYSIRQDELIGPLDSRQVVLVMSLRRNDELLSRNIKYFEAVKDLELPEPDIQYTIDSIAGGASIKLWTDKLAKNVFLSVPDQTGFFSDNYFDLLSEDTAIIEFTGKYSSKELKNYLKIKNLFSDHRSQILPAGRQVTDHEALYYGK